MATIKQIKDAVRYFPRTIRWDDFNVRTSEKLEAAVYCYYKVTSDSIPEWKDGIFSIKPTFQLTMYINNSATWATSAAKEEKKSALLRHEQGHYDITGCIARDYARRVLNISLSIYDVEAAIGKGKIKTEQSEYVSTEFRKLVTKYDQDAERLMRFFQTDPNTKIPGSYDYQTKQRDDKSNLTATAIFRQNKWCDLLKYQENNPDLSFENNIAQWGLYISPT